MSLEIPPQTLPPLERLRQIVALLRSPEGCPWDIEQTQQSLIPCILEEAHEVIEALSETVNEGSKLSQENCCDELGDLLLQVVMQAQIASEEGLYNFEDIASSISEKLIRRHPHVFGEAEANNSQEVLKQWEEIKKTEKNHSQKTGGKLLGINKALPALLQAQKIQKKAAKTGFDWQDHLAALEKLEEEISELKEAISSEKENPSSSFPSTVQEELSDLLFSAVNVSRKLGYDAESTLLLGNLKFSKRYQLMLDDLAKQGISPEKANLADMEESWQRAKNIAHSAG